MPGLSKRSRLPALLMALCIGVGGLVVLQLSRPSGHGGLEAAVPPAATKGNLDLDFDDNSYLRQPPHRQLVGSILERPLFAPTRRPAVKVTPSQVVKQTIPEPKPKPQARSLGAVLLGTVIGQNERIALVASASGGQSNAVEEGEEYEGWTLIFVDEGVAVFQRESAKEVIRLKYREVR